MNIVFRSSMAPPDSADSRTIPLCGLHSHVGKAARWLSIGERLPENVAVRFNRHEDGYAIDGFNLEIGQRIALFTVTDVSNSIHRNGKNHGRW